MDVLITDVDPDYQWVDSFRTSRSSNEASQRMLQQLSCRLRREMGRKALEMGGNVVLAFKESFDVEEYTRTITVRGIGTAAFVFDLEDEEPALHSPSSPTGSIDIITLSALPSGLITSIGGVVSARSIKLISEELAAGPSADENVRDVWLNELREDIRSHARRLNCNAVMNYTEGIRIKDDIYFLSAEATACKVDYAPLVPTSARPGPGPSITLATETEDYFGMSAADEDLLATARLRGRQKRRACCAAHVPYHRQRAPYEVDLSLCRICQKRYVPDLLLATIEPPTELETAGETGLVEAFVFKPLKHKKDNELIAATISSAMPFVEYDMHRQLLYKLRLRGYNGIFGLKYSIAVSATAIVAVATGTAMLLLGLPPPEPLKISRDLEVKDEEDRWIVEIQQKISFDAENNHARVDALLDTFTHLHVESSEEDSGSLGSSSESDDSTSSSDTDSETDRAKLAVVQIDDETDEDLVLVLLEPEFRDSAGFLAGNLEGPPPLDLTLEHRKAKIIPQLITVFKKVRINQDGRHLPFQLARVFHSIYREAWLQASLSFQTGLVLRSVRHQVSITKEGDVQILTYATVFGEMGRPSEEEDEDRQERAEEWEELISLDVSTSSDDSDMEDRIFTRRRRRSLEDVASADDLTDQLDRLRNTVTSPGGKIQKFLIAGHMNHVELSPASTIPASVTVSHFGAVSLKFFKEIHLSEIPGGTAFAFTHDLLLEAFAVVRAHVIALGGNALVHLQIRPGAFLENFKNQLHAILHISGDVLEVELDEPDAWSVLPHRALYSA